MELALRKWKSDIEAWGIIIGFYLFLEMVMGIGCPFKFMTGISDAGCGMSRAWLRVLRLDFIGAFYYHPLWMLPVPGLMIILCKSRIPANVYRGLVVLFSVLFLGVYVYRMFFMPGQDIVVFRPWEGFVFRMIRAIYIKITSCVQ